MQKHTHIKIDDNIYEITRIRLEGPNMTRIYDVNIDNDIVSFSYNEIIENKFELITNN